MTYRRITGKELSWLIVLSAYAPDFDIIADRVFNTIGINILVYGARIHHGDFHNIGILLLYALSLAFLFKPLGFRFRDSFAGIGFGAHLFEDAMVSARLFASFGRRPQRSLCRTIQTFMESRI